MRSIKIDKTDSISRIYQIMIVSILKNRNQKYYSYFIIKFVGFMLIYYDINFDIISWFLVIYILNISIYFKFKSI